MAGRSSWSSRRSSRNCVVKPKIGMTVPCMSTRSTHTSVHFKQSTIATRTDKREPTNNTASGSTSKPPAANSINEMLQLWSSRSHHVHLSEGEDPMHQLPPTWTSRNELPVIVAPRTHSSNRQQRRTRRESGFLQVHNHQRDISASILRWLLPPFSNRQRARRSVAGNRPSVRCWTICTHW